MNPRKAPPLPSDHPTLQGMKDTPSINKKSIDLTNERRNRSAMKEGSIGNEQDAKKVHSRLHSQDLKKNKVAKQVE